MSNFLFITDRSSVETCGFDAPPHVIVSPGNLCDVGCPVTTIACDVVLDGFGAVEAVRAALTRYRTDTSIPLIYIVDDGDVLTYAMANALGVTAIRSRASAPSTCGVYAAPGPVSTVVAANSAAVSADAMPLESLVETVAASLKRILEPEDAAQRLSPQHLGDGAEALLLAVQQNDIRTWVAVVRGYDDSTYQHCLLVAGLVTHFAARLGMSFKTQHLLAQAALVHDVGKSKVPSAILNKPGPLTDAEMLIMRKHPATGYYMLAYQTGMDPRILDIVRHHHEYLDGSGYPDRLKAAQISDLCRLVTICDIYAALIERRPYRPPMPPEKAFAILVEMGPKLDSMLLEAFRQLVDDLALPNLAAA